MSVNSARPMLDGQQFDIVIIGGGINGVAIARECALAGRDVLLLEQNDFASGTTSRSTRIIHGGLRYLQYAEIGLVRESLQERDRLLRERPQLVRPLRFVLALDGGSRFSALQIRTGLWLYGKLAGNRWSADPHRSAARQLEAELDSGRSWSLFEYDDAQCEFPERLVAEWAVEAATAGATLCNYALVLDIEQVNGRVTGVLCRDRLSGRECSIACNRVINATGPWVDKMCAEASVPTGGRLVGGVRGSHLVLPQFPGAPETALYTHGVDRRPIFVVPWNHQILLGTTEVPDSSDPSSVAPSAGEIDYLLQSANKLFPRAGLGVSDVHYAFAGIRPLPFMEDTAPSAITRKALLYDHRQDGVEGMISVIGGKLTTAASLARRCAKAIGIHTVPVSEAPVPINDANGIETTVRRWADAMARHVGVSPNFAEQTASLYGPSALAVLNIAASDEQMMQTLCPHTQRVVAEAIYALRSEHAVMLSDVLLRRVPVALGPCWSPECTRTAATRIGAASGWNEEELEWQIETAELERAAFFKKPEFQVVTHDPSSMTERLA
ncbi:MAG TPA: glycerol-3-phosphate dehydrogenase/oxidase [Terriglobales bacterium]|nr:glycerol-3-phosphate dehydrogenase/oxidase [Terriglobales bacterium]